MKCCMEECRHRITTEGLNCGHDIGDEILLFMKRMQHDNLGKHVGHTIYNAF